MQESPPFQRLSRSALNAEQSPQPHQLFTNLEGCNVGFKHYHPTPVTQNGNKLSGQSGMGGVWEWTSTVLDKHKGFKPMDLYPGYTGCQFSIHAPFRFYSANLQKADFFDGKHNIVLGGSWATHPRIAGRKSL